MRGPAHRLAEVTRDLRQALDTGSLPLHVAKRQLRSLGLELLRRYPADAELWRGFENLRGAGFQPPAMATIPSGTETDVLEQVWAMSESETSQCASALLELPDPSIQLGRARAVMEILLRSDGESERVALLLKALQPFESAERLARWKLTAHLRFGHSLGQGEFDDWIETEASALRGIEAARLWRLLAVKRLCELDGHGLSWLAPCCGGLHILNWEAALRRRPLLSQEARELQTMLERARDLAGSDAPGMTSVERLVQSAEDADRRGDYATGTDAVASILRRFPTSIEWQHAAQCRAELLMDADFAARLESEFGLTSQADVMIFEGLQWPRSSSAGDAALWCERLTRLGEAGSCENDDDRFYLEATGAIERASNAWIELNSTLALQEAARLARDAEASLRGRVREAILSHLEADELVLAEDADALELVRRLVPLLPPGSDRRDWCVRLVAAGAGLPERGEVLSEDASEDPHSPANRIAAGDDLLAEGHVDGAAAIATSLLGKVEDPALTERYLAFVRKLFRESDVPLALKESVGRHIRSRGFFAQSLLGLFVEDSRAAHPMLEVLHGIGKDGDISDRFRFDCLRAWLRVWRVTDTVPADGLIRPFMRQDGGLLVLAAASIAGLADPSGAASKFLAAYPPLEHPPSTWARQLLDLGAASA